MAGQDSAPVVIVGAGGAGCTLALLLARYDIPSILVERRTKPLRHPAAHVLNGRSFEIWSQYTPALADEILALCPSETEIGDIHWCSSLLGEQLGRINLLANTNRVEQIKGFSPYRIAHVGQHLLMPILWRTVADEPLITLYKGATLERFNDHDQGVTVDIRSPQGHTTSIESRWLIGADGANSAVREQLGIDMQGPVLANMASIFFRMKLDDVYPPPRPLITWIYNPHFCGVLIKHADDDYVLMTPVISPEQAIVKGGTEYWKKIIPKAIGSDRVPFEIHTNGQWAMTAQLAATFGQGRTLLIGDAAHRFPHTGGFGLNSGVQDAHNLAWKLAAVLEDRARPALLDSYETERKPVVRRFADQSVTNHFKLDEVTRHVGLRNENLMQMTRHFASAPLRHLPKAVHGRLADTLMRLALRRTGQLARHSRGGRRLRARVGREIPGQMAHFISTGLEYGFAYIEGFIQPEDTPQPLIDDGVADYRPTTWPGSRLPHLLVDHHGQPTPIHDLIDKRRFTLVSADANAWQEAIDALPDGIDMGLAIVNLSIRDSVRYQAAIERYEVGTQGAVLVRPDQHVAWRTTKPAARAAQTLVDVANALFAPYRQHTHADAAATHPRRAVRTATGVRQH